MALNKSGDVVSAEIITDYNSIREEIGLNVEESFLYQALGLDAWRDVAPTLVKTAAKEYYIIAKQIEEGNLSANGRASGHISRHNIKTIYYGSYFTWESSQVISEPPPATPAEALAKALKTDNVTANKDMPLSRYREFQKEFSVTLNRDEKKTAKISVYKVDTSGFTAAGKKDRAAAVETALELINQVSTVSSEDKDVIKENILKNQSDKFGLLDTLLSRKNLSCLLASSRINLQEIAPLPWEQLKDGILALYKGQQAFVLSPEPIENPLLQKTGDYSNMRDALDSLIGDAILGIEEKNLGIGLVREIGLDKVADATDLFRTWREQSAHSDLPYYVIASQATRYALENAVTFVAEALEAKRHITEKDTEAKFLALFDEFKLKYNCSYLDIKKYFVVLHAGTRTPYASLSSDFLLNTEMNSLKIDAGILIFHNGILRACSDMARSLVLTKEGKDVYDLTEKLMVECAIPAAIHGHTGSDVYWAGVLPLVKMENTLKEWGMLPPGASIRDSYNRDIGHIMAKQEPVTLGLVKAETNLKLQSGMIGAVEYQWPYKNHALGIEDHYLVTEKKGINISR